MPRKSRNKTKKAPFIGPKNKPKRKSNGPKTVIMPSVKINTGSVNAPLSQKHSKALMEMVCSVTNPFCMEAKGARWPDGNGMSSMTGCVRGHISVANNAAGGVFVCVNPGLSNSYTVATNTTGNFWNIGANTTITPGSTAVTAYASLYRITSAGIIVRNLLPAMTASGYIIITRQGSPAVLNSAATTSIGNVYGVQTETHALVAGLEIPLVFRPIGDNAHSFTALTSSSVWPNPNAWDSLTIETVGTGNALTPIDIEFVYHVEFLLTTANQALEQFLPVSAPSNDRVAHLSELAGKTLSSLAYKGVETFGRATMAAVSSLIARPEYLMLT